MAEFVSESKLNSVLEDLIENAEKSLILISPYIKLHDRLKDKLKPKRNNPYLELCIIFGKNEDDPTRSIHKGDLTFFQEFLDVEIRYERRLHAKYYANENKSLLTSMNLYDYSQNNNIEFGILTKITGTIARLTNQSSLDEEAYMYFDQVIENSELLFRKEPVFQSKNLGLTKTYTHSEIKTNKLDEFFSKQPTKRPKTTSKPTHQEPTKGYCIRTGTEIPFNPQRPMSAKAYQSWAKFNNPDYPEKYCHKTGQKSNGKTSMSKPIM